MAASSQEADQDMGPEPATEEASGTAARAAGAGASAASPAAGVAASPQTVASGPCPTLHLQCAFTQDDGLILRAREDGLGSAGRTGGLSV